MGGLIICTVLGNCTLIYSAKMHAKAFFLAAKGLFYCPKVLNYVCYIVRYAQITLEVHKAICSACKQHGTMQYLR